MSTLPKNEICKRLSHAVYGGEQLNSLATNIGYNNKDTISISGSDGFHRANSGLVAAFYYNETLNEGFIAYRGSERKGLGENVFDLKDWQNDLALMQDKIPSQFYDALYFYNTVYNQYKDRGATICLTGHSLGGALAQLVSSCSAGTHQTFTFNAPGVMHLLDNIRTQTGSQLKNNYSHSILACNF